MLALVTKSLELTIWRKQFFVVTNRSSSVTRDYRVQPDVDDRVFGHYRIRLSDRVLHFEVPREDRHLRVFPQDELVAVFWLHRLFRGDDQLRVRSHDGLLRAEPHHAGGQRLQVGDVERVFEQDENEIVVVVELHLGVFEVFAAVEGEVPVER